MAARRSGRIGVADPVVLPAEAHRELEARRELLDGQPADEAHRDDRRTDGERHVDEGRAHLLDGAAAGERARALDVDHDALRPGTHLRGDLADDAEQRLAVLAIEEGDQPRVGHTRVREAVRDQRAEPARRGARPWRASRVGVPDSADASTLKSSDSTPTWWLPR